MKRLFCAGMTLCCLLLGTRRAGAANVSDLKPNYSGDAHSTTDPSSEDNMILSFDTGNIRPGGKFDFITIGVHVPGKVTNKGKVTVSGKIKTTFGMQTYNLKMTLNAQLTATGKYMIGVAHFQGTVNGSPLNVTEAFDVAGGPPNQAPPAGGALLPLPR
jgi:hypothetical protein